MFCILHPELVAKTLSTMGIWEVPHLLCCVSWGVPRCWGTRLTMSINDIIAICKGSFLLKEIEEAPRITHMRVLNLLLYQSNIAQTRKNECFPQHRFLSLGGGSYLIIVKYSLCGRQGVNSTMYELCGWQVENYQWVRFKKVWGVHGTLSNPTMYEDVLTFIGIVRFICAHTHTHTRTHARVHAWILISHQYIYWVYHIGSQ